MADHPPQPPTCLPFPWSRLPPPHTPSSQVLSVWTGIPVAKISSEETQRLMQLEGELHRRVIGQGEAVNAIARSVRRARVGLSSPTRPVAR